MRMWYESYYRKCCALQPGDHLHAVSQEGAVSKSCDMARDLLERSPTAGALALFSLYKLLS